MTLAPNDRIVNGFLGLPLNNLYNEINNVRKAKRCNDKFNQKAWFAVRQKELYQYMLFLKNETINAILERKRRKL